MYDTSGTYSVCDGRTFDWRHTHARLNWLSNELARHEGRRVRLALRADDEEEQAFIITRPVATRDAFALFGALVGLLPPAAIFLRMFNYGIGVEQDWGRSTFFFLCLSMNVVCLIFGRAMGAHLGRQVDALRARSWVYTITAAVLLGVVWGFMTGALGGLVFFGIGAIFGAAFAIPIGALAFAVFTPLHRLLARGGMIESRRLWPLAFGVACAIAALILGIQ